jgi:Protein of unknown function (DUF3810)
MANNRPTEKLKFKAIAIVALGVIIFCITLAADHPLFIERFYSNGLYPIICRVLHPVLNFFPFSVGDLFYIFLIIYFIYAAYLIIKLAIKKKFIVALGVVLRMVITVQILYLVFYLFWGLNYFRVPAGERLGLRDSNYTTADLKAVTMMLIDSANVTRARLTVADLSENNDTVYKTAVKAISKLSHDSVNFRTYDPGVKSSILTRALNYIGTSGYYNPFTSEAQINYHMPLFDRPFVACHEMSHQIGFGAEDEANFSGFIAGTGSSDRLLRYSCYHLAVDEFMHALYYRDSLSSQGLKPRISALVRDDFKTERLYWKSYQSKIDVISSIFYNNYLKANNQPQGLDTYNRMVLLVMALYRNKVHSTLPATPPVNKPKPLPGS